MFLAVSVMVYPVVCLSFMGYSFHQPVLLCFEFMRCPSVKYDGVRGITILWNHVLHCPGGVSFMHSFLLSPHILPRP